MNQQQKMMTMMAGALAGSFMMTTVNGIDVCGNADAFDATLAGGSYSCYGPSLVAQSDCDALVGDYVFSGTNMCTNFVPDEETDGTDYGTVTQTYTVTEISESCLATTGNQVAVQSCEAQVPLFDLAPTCVFYDSVDAIYYTTMSKQCCTDSIPSCDCDESDPTAKCSDYGVEPVDNSGLICLNSDSFTGDTMIELEDDSASFSCSTLANAVLPANGISGCEDYTPSNMNMTAADIERDYTGFVETCCTDNLPACDFSATSAAPSTTSSTKLLLSSIVMILFSGMITVQID